MFTRKHRRLMIRLGICVYLAKVTDNLFSMDWFISDLDTAEREAVVLFDFNPRNAKELSLKKGETVMLKTRISTDWWDGSTAGGQKGLIPHRFIALQLRFVTFSL
jgi:SH3 domain